MKTKEGGVMDIQRQGQLVEVLGSEISNKYSVKTTDSSPNTKTHSFGGRFSIPEPVVKFFHDGRELEISPNKDEDPYAAIARYVFELNDEVEKLKSELAKAQAVPEGYCVVPIESLEESLDWANVAKWDSPNNSRDEEINKHEEIIRAIIEAQDEDND